MHAKFLQEKLEGEFNKIEDDLKRSNAVLQFYVDSIARFEFPDPTKLVMEITDGTGDGGLDGYIFDSSSGPLCLLQCKWYTNNVKLGRNEALDLLNFYRINLVKGSTTNLREEVKAFVKRYGQFSKFQTKLIYITNGTFDPSAKQEYEDFARESGVEFELVNGNTLGEKYRSILAEKEPYSNEITLSIVGNKHLQLQARYPCDEGFEDIDVVQCAIHGIDLKRAFDQFEETVFARNLRLGIGGKINEGIQESAKSNERSAFFVLHNGVSIVCEDFRAITVDNANSPELLKVPSEDQSSVLASIKEGITEFIVLKDFQIVNGAQTTITFEDVPETFLRELALPCKISKTSDANIASRIAVCNNTQNKITPWDLVANSDELTLLQNYASRLTPPVFVQRRRGEKWSQVRFTSSPKPNKSRSLVAKDVYQSYLSFCGHPGPAYSRPGTVLAPNLEVYKQVKDTGDLDKILIAGLMAKYENSIEAGQNDPEFVPYWKQWVVALAGHLYSEKITPNEQEAFKRAIISDAGPQNWLKMRGYYESLLKEFIGFFEEDAESQKIFKDNEEVWSSAKFPFNPRSIWTYINPKIRDASFETMREKQSNEPILLAYYNVNFAILAAFVDQYMNKSPLTRFW